MRIRTTLGLVGLAALLAAWPLARGRSASDAPAADGAPAADADALYDRFCLACHGAERDGRGPGSPWLWPRPRDFTRGAYKWRSTPSGRPPTRDDLARAIRYGVPGTSMHAFGVSLSGADIDALAEHLASFAPRTFGRDATPVEVPETPPVTPALLARGAEQYQALGCAQCHGDDLRGDGPSADELTADERPAPPYDLTSAPLRRPRAPGDDPIRAVYLSLVTGLDGTPMPSYDGAAPADDLLAVAAFVASRLPDDPPHPPLNGDGVIPELARRTSRAERLVRTGHYPGGDPAAEVLFGGPIRAQGPAPVGLTPAQASVDADQCARCHAAQHRQWQGSLHAAASSPGLIAQLLPMEAHGRGASLESCQRCHAPLAEQAPVVSAAVRGVDGDDFADNPSYDPELRLQGINCAGCHVRGWQRYGPARVAADLLSLAGYPRTELAVYERADFCLPCHQLTPASGVGGKPLLNTYVEWLQGPYMRRGVQCQHCHMPNREHTWKGVHDPDTFRQGIAVEAIAARSEDSGAVSVRARVRNVGAGHYLPTTPTPAAFVAIELVDGDGRAIAGARTERRIGRHLRYEGGRFVEVEDSRIPPGEALEISGAWKDGRTAAATHAVITVRVEPDEYYERFYRRRLGGKLPAEERRLFRDALERAEGSHFVALRERVPIR